MNKLLFTAIITTIFSANVFGIGKLVLQPEQMRQDIKILREALTNLHPGLYRYNTKEQIESYFGELEAKAKNTLDEKEFYLLISQLTARIKCGHTFMNPLNLDDKVADRVFSKRNLPFYFLIIDQKIVITHNVSDNLAIKRGDEITKINGISSAKIISTLLTVSRGDGNNSIGKRISNLNLIPDESYDHPLFDIYFPLFFPSNSDRFLLEIQHANGKKKTQSVNSVSTELRRASYGKQYGEIPKDEKTWEFKLINDKTAYLKFGTFSFWNSKFDWKTYLKNTFDEIQAKPNIKNLIIDLRGNEGGSGEISNTILSYIASKAIGGESQSKTCHSFLSVPEPLLKYLSTWDRTFKQPKKAENFVKNKIGLYEEIANSDSSLIQPKSNRFTGAVYLLTDPVNSSATFHLAWTFQTNKLGKIIGETTGGTKQGLNGGKMFFLTLPNSMFEIDLPIVYWYHQGMPDEGVKPDFIVKSSIESVRQNQDNQLDFTLDLIKKNSSK